MTDPRADLEYDLRFGGQDTWADRLSQLPGGTPEVNRYPTDPREALNQASPARQRRSSEA